MTDGINEFLLRHHRAILVTRRADGGLQTSPVVAGLDDAGRAVVSSTEETAKVRNLRRDPRTALCVFTDGFFGPWIQVEGTAEIVSMPDAMEPLIDYYRSVAGEHPDWAEYRAAMERERRCLIAIAPDRVIEGGRRPTASTG